MQGLTKLNLLWWVLQIHVMKFKQVDLSFLLRLRKVLRETLKYQKKFQVWNLAL